MKDDNVENERGGQLYITLGSYLADLESQQLADVPTIRDLAESVGIHEVTLHNISKSRIKHLNLETAQRIMDEMNRRGFRMQLTDFMRYVPPEAK